MNEMSFFSEIDDMNAELEGLKNPGRQSKRKRNRLEADESTDFNAMLSDLEKSKQLGEYPYNDKIDLTIKHSTSARGDHAQRDEYKDLSFGSVCDLLTKKYR